MCWVFIAASRSYSLVAVHGLLTWWLLLSGRGLQPRGLQWLRLLGPVVGPCGLRSAGSVVGAHRLSCPHRVGSFWSRDRTHVPCIGRQILFFNVFIFNWKISASQYFTGFYHTSGWISHRYTCVPPSWTPLPPHPPPVLPFGGHRAPDLCSCVTQLIPTGQLSWHVVMCMSRFYSRFIPPCPSPSCPQVSSL